jgi:hypothetical protein
MHALRAAFNSSYGEVITSGAVSKSQIISKTHSYTLPSNFVDKHCNIVVFVYKAKTYEIIQADMKKVIE